MEHLGPLLKMLPQAKGFKRLYLFLRYIHWRKIGDWDLFNHIESCMSSFFIRPKSRF